MLPQTANIPVNLRSPWVILKVGLIIKKTGFFSQIPSNQKFDEKPGF